MKQVLQAFDTGETEVVNIPAPKIQPGHLLIQTQATLVSAGTERMLVEFGKANFINKARQQPEKVKEVVQKIKTDGFGPTIKAVQNKLRQPIPLGYCNAGVVLEVGQGVADFQVGDRVVSNGAHAEVVVVPKNLCAKIPETQIEFEEAAFTVLVSIGLQGLRLMRPTLGESVVVTGLGLIGLLTVQLLKAQGCRVLGIDYSTQRLELARSFGATTVDLSQGEDVLAAASRFSKGNGVDGVVITASTKSSEPVHQAAQMCRKRGRIVLVGVTGLELNRSDFYEKELSFQVSCSYGPGRYDNDYEQLGHDYPIGFVRWTEQRNFEAVLDCMSAGRLDLKSLITHRFDIQDAAAAYEVISNRSDSLGIVLEYPNASDADESQLLVRQVSVNGASKPSSVTVGVIGAGSFTQGTLLPAIKDSGATLKTIVSSGGMSGVTAARRFNIEEAATDVDAVLHDDQINAVFITTRHNSHASLVQRALSAGKHVFVEKPLAITRDGLKEVCESYQQQLEKQDGDTIVSIGFNRRFSPQIVKMKQLLETLKQPKTMIMTVNAGEIPPDHWTQDATVGGGRILGEACHFVDLLRCLTGSSILSVWTACIASDSMKITDDKATITLTFADGSIGTIHYFANGNKAFPKERLEVFCGGKILALDNFRKLKGYGWSNFKRMNLRSQNKGHHEGVRAFVDAIRLGGPAPIPFDEIVEVSNACFDAAGIGQEG